MVTKMKQLCALLLILISLVSFSQSTNPVVTGKVTDRSGNPVQAATISVLKGKDSSLVKIFTADKSGIYQLERLPDGKYLLAVSAIGHSKTYSQPFEVKTG